MELLSWIDASKLHTRCLNENENSLYYLSANMHLMKMPYIGENRSLPIPFYYELGSILHFCPSIYSNVQPGIEKIIRTLPYTNQNWYYICKNPSCIDLILENPKKYDYHWAALSTNSKAVPFLLQHFEQIHWEELCQNHSEEAVELLLQYPHLIDWMTFSSNPYAIDYLRKNPDKINFWGLSWNHNAIDLIEKNIDKSCWMGISRNKNAIHLLKQHQDKIDWLQFSLNPSIFAYPYERFAYQRSNILREELMKKTLHPRRIQYWLENGMNIDDLPE